MSMKTKLHALMTSVVASAALLGAVSIASAADQWFVLGEQTLKTADPSVEIVAEGSRWDKDVKQVKLSAEGADVQVSEVILHWANRRDDKISDVGTLKSGGETAPKNAPGLKARLKSITVTYKILGGAPTATLKVWGYD
jgi:hypothetical protein